jgi:hypothetical protein
MYCVNNFVFQTISKTMKKAEINAMMNNLCNFNTLSYLF